MNRYKPVGWRGESRRHYLAAKGIKTRYFVVQTKIGPLQSAKEFEEQTGLKSPNILRRAVEKVKGLHPIERLQMLSARREMQRAKAGVDEANITDEMKAAAAEREAAARKPYDVPPPELPQQLFYEQPLSPNEFAKALNTELSKARMQLMVDAMKPDARGVPQYSRSQVNEIFSMLPKVDEEKKNAAGEVIAPSDVTRFMSELTSTNYAKKVGEDKFFITPQTMDFVRNTYMREKLEQIAPMKQTVPKLSVEIVEPEVAAERLSPRVKDVEQRQMVAAKVPGAKAYSGEERAESLFRQKQAREGYVWMMKTPPGKASVPLPAWTKEGAE